MRGPLRICLVASSRFPVREPFAGGLEALTHGLARELVRRGHQVSLFAAPGSDPRLPVTALPVPTFTPSAAARADVGATPAEWMAEHHAYLGLMLELGRDGHRRFDVVHNNSLHHLPVAMAGSLTVPVVTTMHTPPLAWLESAAQLAQGAVTFTAVSAHTARAWAHVADCEVVLNGVDTASVAPRSRWRPGGLVGSAGPGEGAARRPRRRRARRRADRAGGTRPGRGVLRGGDRAEAGSAGVVRRPPRPPDAVPAARCRVGGGGDPRVGRAVRAGGQRGPRLRHPGGRRCPRCPAGDRGRRRGRAGSARRRGRSGRGRSDGPGPAPGWPRADGSSDCSRWSGWSTRYERVYRRSMDRRRGRVIGWYVHHHGRGHLHRALAVGTLLAARGEEVTAAVLPAPPRGLGRGVGPPRAGRRGPGRGPDGARTAALGARRGRRAALPRGAVSAWLAACRPRLVVVDVSVEVALLVRLHGVPVVSVALPGRRGDRRTCSGSGSPTSLVAAWPASATGMLRDVPAPLLERLRPVGGLSRFPVREPGPRRPGPRRLVVLMGTGGHELDHGAAGRRSAADTRLGVDRPGRHPGDVGRRPVRRGRRRRRRAHPRRSERPRRGGRCASARGGGARRSVRTRSR